MVLRFATKKWHIGFDVPEHVRDNEESHVAAANINLIEMGDTAIASCNGDVLQLDVHVVLGCCENMVSVESRKTDTSESCLIDWLSKIKSSLQDFEKHGSHTFQKLPPVHDAGCDLKRHDMALSKNGVSSVSRYPRSPQFRVILHPPTSHSDSNAEIRRNQTHLRFIEELDRDADRGGELAHFDCVAAIKDQKVSNQAQMNNRELPSHRTKEQKKTMGGREEMVGQ